MKSFYIGFASDRPSLMDDQIIHGHSAIEAVRATYSTRRVTAVYGDDARYADLILQECVVKDGEPYLLPRKKRCCYRFD